MIKIILVLSFCLAFIVSPANAGVIDPIPLFKNIQESPREGSLFSQKTGHIFCPLSKKFHKHDDEVAVKTIILEAAGEGYRGMVAVGEVIRNRSDLFHKDFNTVCLMPKQFSCWNDRARAKRFIEKHRDYYFIALAAWVESEKSALTGGATDYHADRIHPTWADSYRVAAHIGKHIFYVRK